METLSKINLLLVHFLLTIYSCETGMRFSDYNSMRAENICEIDGDLFIKKTTQKTKEEIIIPCNSTILQLFEKYKDRPNKLPRSISSVKFNLYIKDACKLAELTEKGRLSTQPEKMLWQCVTTHTARRSFATNSYLSNVPPIHIMKLTGHKTEKSFMRYIRLGKLDAAKGYSEFMKQNKSKIALRIAI